MHETSCYTCAHGVKSCGKIYPPQNKSERSRGDAPRSLAGELNARRLRRENKNEYFESIYKAARQVLNEPEEIMICEDEGFFTPLTVFARRRFIQGRMHLLCSFFGLASNLTNDPRRTQDLTRCLGQNCGGKASSTEGTRTT